MNIKKNVALLCDYGLDDVIATLYLFENADGFEKIDIVPVGGNFPLNQTFINAKRLLTYADKIPSNIRIVDSSRIKQNAENLSHIHGNDGMGDILPLSYEERVEVIDYEAWLKEVDESYTILSLGPCTVTLDILQKKNVAQLIIMAGNIEEEPNQNGYEFNHALDKEAFAECVKYPHAIATLDSCHCDACDLNRIALPTTDELFGKMLKRYLEKSNDRKETVCAVYDLVAVVYSVHPERFQVYTATDKDDNILSVLRYTGSGSILD